MDITFFFSRVSHSLLLLSQLSLVEMKHSFIEKLLAMLAQPELSPILRWSQNGDSIVVIDTDLIGPVVLSKYFKHGNFSSFTRQMHLYGFHKARSFEVQDGVQFSHPDFVRGQPALALTIRRSTSKSSKEGYAYSPKAAAELSDLRMQLDVLRRENHCLAARNRQLQEKLSKHGAQPYSGHANHWVSSSAYEGENIYEGIPHAAWETMVDPRVVSPTQSPMDSGDSMDMDLSMYCGALEGAPMVGSIECPRMSMLY